MQQVGDCEADLRVAVPTHRGRRTTIHEASVVVEAIDSLLR
jgi:hypothetical protein